MCITKYSIWNKSFNLLVRIADKLAMRAMRLLCARSETTSFYLKLYDVVSRSFYDVVSSSFFPVEGYRDEHAEKDAWGDKEGQTRRNEEVRERIGMQENIVKVVERSKMRWYEHVVRKGERDVVRRAMDCPVMGKRNRGRQPRRWKDWVEARMKELGVGREDALDRKRRRGIVAADPSWRGKRLMAKKKVTFVRYIVSLYYSGYRPEIGDCWVKSMLFFLGNLR